MSSVMTSWNMAFGQKRFRILFGLIAVILPSTLFFYRSFLDFVETRQGVTLSDPLLAVVPVVDLTWLTFSLVYGGLATAIILLIGRPTHFLRALASYVILVLIRGLCMYVVPLEPPPDAIPLVDPIVEYFGASAVTLTKDLFFSGHTATLGSSVIHFHVGQRASCFSWGQQLLQAAFSSSTSTIRWTSSSPPWLHMVHSPSLSGCVRITHRRSRKIQAAYDTCIPGIFSASRHVSSEPNLTGIKIACSFFGGNCPETLLLVEKKELP